MIHISGEAAIQVPADEVTLTLKVAASNQDKAKLPEFARRNVSRVSELKELFALYKISSSDIKFVDYRFVESREYVDENRNAMRSIFTVEQTLSGKLRDVSKLASFIPALLNKQYDIVNIEFCNSNLAQYKDQARTMAVQNAKTKATLLAKTLGQNIGKTQSLTEKESGWYFGSYRSRGGQGDYGAAIPSLNITNDLEATGMNVQSAQVGLIVIHAEVSVDFELL